MKYLAALIFAILASVSAASHGDPSPYEHPNVTWILVSLDGKPFPARATLTFPETGRIAGQAPCNRYFAEMRAEYPWFKAERIGATRMACPDLDHETAYFTALSEMTLAYVEGEDLILASDAGREMVFTVAPRSG